MQALLLVPDIRDVPSRSPGMLTRVSVLNVSEPPAAAYPNLTPLHAEVLRGKISPAKSEQWRSKSEMLLSSALNDIYGKPSDGDSQYSLYEYL